MTPSSPATRCWKMACDIDDREGESPSPMEPRLGGCSAARRPVAAVDVSSLRRSVFVNRITLADAQALAGQAQTRTARTGHRHRPRHPRPGRTGTTASTLTTQGIPERVQSSCRCAAAARWSKTAVPRDDASGAKGESGESLASASRERRWRARRCSMPDDTAAGCRARGRAANAGSVAGHASRIKH